MEAPLLIGAVTIIRVRPFKGLGVTFGVSSHFHHKSVQIISDTTLNAMLCLEYEVGQGNLCSCFMVASTVYKYRHNASG